VSSTISAGSEPSSIEGSTPPSIEITTHEHMRTANHGQDSQQLTQHTLHEPTFLASH
jgi:hypothetical protein